MGSKLSLSFRILKNGQLVRSEKLTLGVIKIGKVPSAHLHLDDDSVSRMHAIIEVIGTDVSLIDLGSTRGSFVNGQRINKARLQGGDVLTIGEMTLELAITATDMILAAPDGARKQTLPSGAVPVMPAVTQTMAPAVTHTMAPAIAAMPVAARTVPPLPPRAAPAPFAMSTTEADDVGGARAIEIATMFGDSVVNVKHCMEPRGGKVTKATWGWFAAGLACLLGSGIAFATSVNDAARNKAALDYHTRVLHKPAFSYRPVAEHAGLDYLAFGGLALGLLGMTGGLVRMRTEKRSPYFRVGTAPGVEQPLETSPSPSFPLVAPSGDDFVFNYGAGIDGEMIVDGHSTPLSELVAAGRARPSMITTGAIEVPIPARARIRARSGNTTFLVSAVAQPRKHATPLFNVENRTLAYFAGSLAVHLGVWAFLQTIPVEDSGVNVDLTSLETTAMASTTAAKEDMPVKQDEAEVGNSGDTTGESAKMALTEGALGKESPNLDGHNRVKDRNHEPQLSREQAVEEARTAGFMGSLMASDGGITSLTASANFSSGFDANDVNGPMFGAEGEGKGIFGGGVHGFGPGGGCSMPPCGIIGVGKLGLIGTGKERGDGYGGPGDGKGGLHKHVATGPDGFMGRPTSEGDLDKSIIKRYIQRSVDKIAYCYEKELLAQPTLAGTVNVQFLIAPNGTVQASNGSGLDNVSGCVAAVIKSIKFPAPKNGGNVQVKYPFNFHAAGQ